MVSTQHQTGRKVVAYVATLIITLPIVVFTLALGLIAPLPLVVVISFGVVGATAAFVGGAVSNVVVADGAFAQQRRVVLSTWTVSVGLAALLLILLAISTRVAVAGFVTMAAVPWAAIRSAWTDRAQNTTWKRETLEALAWLAGSVVVAVLAINVADLVGWVSP